MKNMRKILSAMTALGVMTVAGTGTVACQNPLTKTVMSDQVKIDLGLIDAQDKKANVVATLDTVADATTYDWSLSTLRPIADSGGTNTYGGLTAANLLNNPGTTNTAKTQDSYNFLKDVLKLTPTQVGTKPDFKNDTFDPTAAANIVLGIDQISPALSLNQAKDNYIVKGTINNGYALAQWKDSTTNPYAVAHTYGDVNKILFKTNDATGILPTSEIQALSLTDLAKFTTGAGSLLENFLATKVNNLKIGDNIFAALKSDGDEAKTLNSIKKATGLDINLKITKFDGLTDNKWSATAANNKITFDLYIGEVKEITDIKLVQTA